MRRRREGVESPTCNVPFAALLVEVWPLSICQETYAEHISMPRITVDGKRANRVDADLSMGIEDFKPKPLSQATAPIARIETNAIDWSVQSESLLLPNAKAHLPGPPPRQVTAQNRRGGPGQVQHFVRRLCCTSHSCSRNQPSKYSPSNSSPTKSAH